MKGCERAMSRWAREMRGRTKRMKCFGKQVACGRGCGALDQARCLGAELGLNLGEAFEELGIGLAAEFVEALSKVLEVDVCVSGDSGWVLEEEGPDAIHRFLRGHDGLLLLPERALHGAQVVEALREIGQKGVGPGLRQLSMNV